MIGALAVAVAATARLDSADSSSRTNTPPGMALFMQHEFAKAAAAFRADLQANPKDLTALLYLGRIAFEENRLNEAVEYFEKAVAAAPQSSEAYHWLGRVYGVQARELGVPRGVGAARRTKKALEKAVALNPDNVEARVDLATYYREAPGIVGGSTRGALAQLDEIARRDPYQGALVRGDVAQDEKRFDDAERQYQAAANLRPRDTEAFYRLGILHQRTQRYVRAFAAFDKMLELDPNDKRAYFQIGKTADLSGQQLDRGERALKTYLESKPFFIMPKLSWAHRRLGDIYLKKGLRAAARREYVAAVQAAPDDKEAIAALRDFDANSASR
jgi:tetratricopeptide (TPR) repeat protein